jgi:hypothetical protein
LNLRYPLMWKIIEALKTELLRTAASWGEICQCPGASTRSLVVAAKARVLLFVRKIGC